MKQVILPYEWVIESMTQVIHLKVNWLIDKTDLELPVH